MKKMKEKFVDFIVNHLLFLVCFYVVFFLFLISHYPKTMIPLLTIVIYVFLKQSKRRSKKIYDEQDMQIDTIKEILTAMNQRGLLDFFWDEIHKKMQNGEATINQLYYPTETYISLNLSSTQLEKSLGFSKEMLTYQAQSILNNFRERHSGLKAYDFQVSNCELVLDEKSKIGVFYFSITQNPKLISESEAYKNDDDCV